MNFVKFWCVTLKLFSFSFVHEILATPMPPCFELKEFQTAIVTVTTAVLCSALKHSHYDNVTKGT